ncbi:MAG TPA: glycosyltransferase, partial [Xanthomonadales bacterium]|nr:glycosyltransferase [Xanthomonadales bacterium]
DGWLIDTDAAALVKKVQELASRPELIETMRQNLNQLPGFSNSAMLQHYQQLCPLAETAINLPPTAGFEQLQYGTASLAAASLTGSNLQLRQQVVTLQAEVDKRTEWAREREAARQAEQSSKEKWVKQLQQEIDTRSAELAHEQAKVVTLEQQYATILASSSWRLTKPLRAGRRVMANLNRAQAWNPGRWPLLLSQAVRTISTSGLRGAVVRAQLSPQQLSEPATSRDYTLEAVGDPTPPASLPHSAQPLVSIIIPVFNKWAYTAACLRSLASSNNLPALEVILLDDHSRDETAELAQQVNGLRYLRNSKNLGFVGSCNRGLEVARGEYTVLLNNDTQVLDGWLDALLETFEKFPDTGLAGAQLLYPDGSLQEAGGIIFNDGSGWNYGKHDDADKPEYHCVREVDYCSGACIMLRTAVFRELNGFDARYAPAYYEDTDLAFRVREAGLKVRYQPAARIIHFEGITSGTDLNSGAKRYQQVNRGKFLQRWEAVLKDYPAPIVNPDD